MTQTTQQLELGRQKIVEDLRVLRTDPEEMLPLRERLVAHVDSLQSAPGDAQNAAQRRYRVAAVNTERYVRHNPWRAIGIAASVGFLLGVLAAR